MSDQSRSQPSYFQLIVMQQLSALCKTFSLSSFCDVVSHQTDYWSHFNRTKKRKGRLPADVVYALVYLFFSSSLKVISAGQYYSWNVKYLLKSHSQNCFFRPIQSEHFTVNQIIDVNVGMTLAFCHPSALYCLFLYV